MLKMIFFDFDGVIVESAGIKTNAFRKLFSVYPEHVDEIVKYHKDNAGVSRYEKFDYIFKNILKQTLGEEKKAEFGRKFSELVFEEVMECSFVHGTLEFLEKYSNSLRLYIASATPDEELKEIVKLRGIDNHFRGVYGAPSKKSDIVSRVLDEDGGFREHALFIGDTTADYEHAQKANIKFVGRTIGNNNPFPKNVKTVRDLKELDTFVEKLL
jgi:HAD superfamily hydrolase (TIGR01549 family)